MSESPAAEVGALVLVGGEARRMGGIAKPLLTLGGRSLLRRTVEPLASAGVAPVVAVGPRLDDTPGVVWAREDPPLGGPVAGIAAGLGRVATEWVFLLAGDLVRPDVVVETLAARRGLDGDASYDGYAFVAGGRAQWLVGLYRAASVRSALAAMAAQRDASVRALLGDLAIDWLLDEDGITDDIDTPADLARARARIEEDS